MSTLASRTNSTRSWPRWSMALTMALFSLGCETSDAPPDSGAPSGDEGGPVDTGAAPGGSIAIAGIWHSNFGGVEIIDDEQWSFAFSADPDAEVFTERVARFDNEARWAITQNAEDAEFSPGAFNKKVWTTPEGGVLYYCTVGFGLDDLETALAFEGELDAADPEAGGCGGFPWTRLAAAAPSDGPDEPGAPGVPIEIEGAWYSNFGGMEIIDAEQWSFTYSDDEAAEVFTERVARFDNEARWAVTQNAEDAEFGPSTYNKKVWTAPEGGAFYYCTIAFGHDDLDAALADPAEADDSSPDTGGCAGFPWTRLTAAPPL